MREPFMSDKPWSILILCTGQQLAQHHGGSVIQLAGNGKFRAYSAGSHPSGAVNPIAIERCEALGYDTAGLLSKSSDEFAMPYAPHMDFVITVCDQAAGEVCPIWPGHPMTAHWGSKIPMLSREVTKRRARPSARAIDKS